MNPNKILKKVRTMYVIGFFFSLSAAIPAYVSSTFLTQFVSDKIVGIFYTIASIITFFLLIIIPKILKKTGNYKITHIFLWLNILSLLAMAFIETTTVVVIAFVIMLISISILYFNFDIFLEHLSDDESTGTTRGSYLSIMNIAWVISPLLTGFILSDSQYWRIFFVSAILLVPVIFFLSKEFKKFEDSKYEEANFWKTLKLIRKRKNIYHITIANFILKFFYSWMVIYTPIYLHNHIGFSWSVIGIIFTIMLLPFIFLEYPLGKLADKKIGEKEILNIGFVIIAVTTASLSFTTSTNPIIWALLLFGTRIGASMVEIATETYFFKKITDDDTNLLSFFRMTRPLAYIFGPLIASSLLFFVSFNYLFIILGGITLVSGLYHGSQLIDTK